MACEMFRVTLTAGGGASPTIERISPETLWQRLQDVLHWPKKAINDLNDKLMTEGRLMDERLESPTREQLQQLGFSLEGWRGRI